VVVVALVQVIFDVLNCQFFEVKSHWTKVDTSLEGNFIVIWSVKPVTLESIVVLSDLYMIGLNRYLGYTASISTL